MSMNTFEQFLLTRDITLPSVPITRADIASDAALLTRAGNVASEHYDIFKLIIEARIAPLREELLLRASPYETTEIRRAILEIAALLDDLTSYKVALENLRKEEAESNLQGGNGADKPPEGDGLQDNPNSV